MNAEAGDGPNRRLDETDVRILRMLEANGRATYEEMARRVNLSANAVRGRVQTLVRRRVIRGIHADVDWTLKPDAFEEERIEPLNFAGGRDSMVVEVRDFGRAAISGIEIEQTGFHVWRVRDGRLVRLELYYDRPLAYAAAGLPGGRSG